MAVRVKWHYFVALMGAALLGVLMAAPAGAYPNPNVPSADKVAKTAAQDGAGTEVDPGNTTTSVQNLGIPEGTTAACEASMLTPMQQQYKAAKAAGKTSLTWADIDSHILPQITGPCTNGVTLNTTTTVKPVKSSPVQIPRLHSCSVTNGCLAASAQSAGLPPTYIVTWQGTTCDGVVTCYVAELPGYANWSETYKDVFLCDGIWASSDPPATLTGWSAANVLWNATANHDDWQWIWKYGGFGFQTNYILTRDYFTITLGYGPVSHSWNLWIWVNDYNSCKTAAGVHGSAW